MPQRQKSFYISNSKNFETGVREFIEGLPLAMLILDGELRIVAANSAYKNLVLQPNLNVLGQRFNSLPFNMHGASVAACCRSALTEHRDFIVEDYNVELKCWLEYRIFPHHLGVAAIITEINDKRMREAHLAQQALSSTFLLSGVDCGIARVGLDGRWLNINKSFSRLTGYDQTQLERKFFGDLFEAEQHQKNDENLVKLLKGEAEIISADKLLKKADGSRCWVSVKINLVRSTDKKPQFFAVVIDDIAERKEAEESLNFALQAGEMGNWDYDALNNSTRRSHRFNEIFGYKQSPEKWGYQDFIEHIHPSDQMTVEKEFTAALAKGKNLSIECRIVRPSREIRWVALLGRAYTNTEGSTMRMAGLISDITSKKQTAQELQFAKLAAEDASREKSYFLANMSHEIRTPLGAILGFTEMLKDESLEDKEKQEYLEIVSRSGKNLASLIDHILDLSKVEAGYLEIEKQSVNLTGLLAEVKALLEPQALSKGLEFNFTIVDPVEHQIVTDPIRLRQILLNIIGNAIKFTETGFVKVVTTFAPQSSGKIRVMFSVTDSGTGLSEAESLRLFQPFTQADSSTTRKYGGTGLGLALSRRLARALGGDLFLASSEKGKGSTFVARIVTEPCSKELQSGYEAAQSLPTRSPSKKRQNLRGVRILIADDSRENQQLFKVLLVKKGASIDLADNGAMALKMVSQKNYDLILMDMQMPELDGYEATKELRRRGTTVPIVALTAHAMRHDREKCMRSGCSEYISKPVEPERLFSIVNEFVHTKH